MSTTSSAPLRDLRIDYPVAIDNDYAIWRAFDNQYWPAHYFIDAQGRIRHHHFGEGEYAESEHVIQQLLAEAGNDGRRQGRRGRQRQPAPRPPPTPATSSRRKPTSAITRAENFVLTRRRRAGRRSCLRGAGRLRLNQWALGGTGRSRMKRRSCDAAGGGIAFRFHARDLHLVLGAGADGKPVRFRVLIDGKPPRRTTMASTSTPMATAP